MHLRTAIKILKGIPGVNLGGCGIAALALYRMLKDNSIEIRFLYRNYGDKSFESNFKILKNGRSKGHCAAQHVMLFRKGKYLDSDGLCEKRIIDTIYPFRLIVDEGFLVKAINATSKWSDKFSRQNVSTIERMIGVTLDDIK